MTARELLNIAVNYIAEYAIDLNEMRFSGVTGQDVREIEEWMKAKLSGMNQLESYLERIIEEEEMTI